MNYKRNYWKKIDLFKKSYFHNKVELLLNKCKIKKVYRKNENALQTFDFQSVVYFSYKPEYCKSSAENVLKILPRVRTFLKTTISIKNIWSKIISFILLHPHQDSHKSETNRVERPRW